MDMSSSPVPDELAVLVRAAEYHPGMKLPTLKAFAADASGMICSQARQIEKLHAMVSLLTAQRDWLSSALNFKDASRDSPDPEVQVLAWRRESVKPVVAMWVPRYTRVVSDDVMCDGAERLPGGSAKYYYPAGWYAYAVSGEMCVPLTGTVQAWMSIRGFVNDVRATPAMREVCTF